MPPYSFLLGINSFGRAYCTRGKVERFVSCYGSRLLDNVREAFTLSGFQNIHVRDLN
jgi:hypothetical protein